MSERYTDDRLDDKFEVHERRLETIELRLEGIDGVKAQMGELTATVNQMIGRMDRFREDTRDDFNAVHDDIKNVSRTQNALLVALLAAMLGALVVLLIAV